MKIWANFVANDVAAKLKVLARWENLPAYVQLTNEIYNSKLGIAAFSQFFPLWYFL